MVAVIFGIAYVEEDDGVTRREDTVTVSDRSDNNDSSGSVVHDAYKFKILLIGSEKRDDKNKTAAFTDRY